MFTRRVVRHGNPDQLLASCQSEALPIRGEVLQLDTTDSAGEPAGPRTLWRVVAVTLPAAVAVAGASATSASTIDSRRMS